MPTPLPLRLGERGISMVSLAEIQLYHVLSTIVAADGAIHPLQLQYQAILIAEMSESLVYPTHLQATVGQLYLRAPPTC